ncbi:putative nucleobase-ascorbate transporter [Vigna angularis]|uniref:Putative nucleobase-ascorbate transporter n=1 Tax=Phaseolus angularis TaxID=3914 RepID=A0A8T0JZJ6_PHAAN|nr:putative nucleobase-ascorbate transporter [Vigna angularis]
MAQDNAACNHASDTNKNAGAAKKVEEVQPHAVHEQLPGVQYCIKSEAVLLGFQHFLLTLGVTVLIPTMLVPQMGGGVAEKTRVFQTLLFVSGISTFLQSLFGTRLPIVVVGSYTYIVPITSIIHARRYNSYTDSYERFIQTMRAIQGALIITACFQMAVGFFGFWRNAVRTQPLSFWFPNESTQNNCRTDRAGLVTAAPWVYFPGFFQWGPPTFNAGEALAMIAASFVSFFEYTGTCYAAARYGSATPVPPSVISRGAGWVGVSALLSGVFGSITGSTASVENAGLLALTKAGSRRVVQISSAFMIFFSIFGKLGAFFASVPMPIIAALYCVLFGYVSSGGLGFLQFCNLNNFRTKFVLGFSFFLGLSIPQYFTEYYHVKEHGGIPLWLNDVVSVIFMSHTTVAALVGFVLDVTLSREDDSARKDISLQWWERFSLYSADVKSDEFYSLPCRLDKLFPPS